LRRKARIIIAVFGVVFAVFVALQFRRRAPALPSSTAVQSDPNAVVESTGGQTRRFSSSRENVSVVYEKLLTYGDGSSRFQGVKITTEDRGGGGRTFVVTAKEGKVGQNESTIALDGEVRLTTSDGMSVRTEHATYADSDGAINAPGPVEFGKGRMSGRGTGLRYEKPRDAVSILASAEVHFAAGDDPVKDPPMVMSSAAMTFARKDRLVHLERDARIKRGRQTIAADVAVGHLSADEKRIESLDLHNHASISEEGGAPGALQSLAGADITLTYAPDGRSLQHAVIFGDSVMRLAGEGGKPGREIVARTLDVVMAPDGTTPTTLTARDAVQLTFPPESGSVARTIQAGSMDAKGEAGRGLTHATFSGGVQFREVGPQNARAARSANLEVVMKPDTGAIDEARFLHSVRFEEGGLAAQAADARYDVVKGGLALSGSEPGLTTPRVINERIAIDAVRIDIVLDGPLVKAAGAVKSTLQPPKGGAGKGETDAKLPAMLKQDQPTNVLADNLTYDGKASLATYTGGARLFQGDTTIKGDTMTIDEKRGDLTASGKAMSTTFREQDTKDNKKERVQSTATAADLKYEDGPRKLTYTGGAHLVGPEGDISAARIILYLKPAGDDVERAEAFTDATDKLTLREQNRTTTGERMTYIAEGETYVVVGIPATVVDECARETIGRTLTFVKSTDTIVVDGNQQIRTQTKGGTGKCG
jgi:lipopolysaccharide transport protein LptA/LPS export ABC transporter protein LptC